MKVGVQSKSAVPSALSTKVAPEGKAEVESTGTVLSASEAVTTKLRLTFSVVLRAPMELKTGVWLPASVTVIVTTSLSESKPSEAMKVILYVPLWMKLGIQSKSALPFKLSVKVTPDGRAEVEKVGVVPSASAAVMLKFKLAPSLTDLAPMRVMTGAWLPTSLTVIETTSLSESTPSEA